MLPPPGSQPKLSPGVYRVVQNQPQAPDAYAVLTSTGANSFAFATFTGAGGTGEQIDAGTINGSMGGYLFAGAGGAGVIDHAGGQKWAWANNTQNTGGYMKREY